MSERIETSRLIVNLGIEAQHAEHEGLMECARYLRQAASRLTELEKDRERLDWLDRQNMHMDIFPNDAKKVKMDVIEEPFCTSFEAVTVRHAIDAAMKGETK